MSFVDRLRAASEAARSLVCVGLDVNPVLMPGAVLRQAQDERGLLGGQGERVVGQAQDERGLLGGQGERVVGQAQDERGLLGGQGERVVRQAHHERVVGQEHDRRPVGQGQDGRVGGQGQDGRPAGGGWFAYDAERAVVEFNRAIVDATADLVCAYKPNIAFYEALGMPGLRALEATIAHIRSVAPGCVVIMDAKRGDIGNTVDAYATAMFDVWGVDAVTVNPWGGLDTVTPWLERDDKGVLVWCRGSNPGAADLQDLVVDEARLAGESPESEGLAADGDGGRVEPVYLRLARDLASAYGGSAHGNLGLVVGATAPEQLAAVREVCPDMPILIPGVGAQGGDLEASVRHGVDAGGRLAIINSARGIIYASSGDDFAAAARTAAGRLRNDINGTLDAMGLGWS